MELFECISPEHVSLYEVRIKAIIASSLGVFGDGLQMEETLMTAIRTKSPKTADLIDLSITAYRRWSEACHDKAPAETIAAMRYKALQSGKDLRASTQT